MRLDKHTNEEIEIAREESGFALPNSEQIEEWKKVHERINQDMARDDLNRRLQIINLDEVIWPYLGQMGKTVARIKGGSTVMELLRNEKSGVYFPWCKSHILGYEYITEAAIEGIECTRHHVLCRYMCKVVEIDKGDTEKLEYWVKRFGAAFSKLAEAGKIKYGILSNFIALPLADLEAETAGQKAMRLAQEAGARIREAEKARIKATKEAAAESKTRRIALLVYPYSHLEIEELNDWVGNPLFVEEGDLGTTDWENLPEADGC